MNPENQQNLPRTAPPQSPVPTAPGAQTDSNQQSAYQYGASQQSNGQSQPAHGQDDQSPQFVYMARPMEPQRQQPSADALRRHEESVKQYPDLNLSQGEYIISAVKQHPIGLVKVWAMVLFVVLAAFGLAAAYAYEMSKQTTTSFSPMLLVIPAALISLLAVLFGFIATTIYNANRFYLTNESVIQHIQLSLFNKREQTISLGNVEDTSYHQEGIFENMFNYGQIRLSTQGDETTYRFHYASSPKKQVALLNNAVEDFKNIRPVSE